MPQNNASRELYGKGRKGTGFGQKRFIDEEHSVAINLFGRAFVESHLEALREGRSRVPLRELIQRKLAQRKQSKS